MRILARTEAEKKILQEQYDFAAKITGGFPYKATTYYGVDEKDRRLELREFSAVQTFDGIINTMNSMQTLFGFLDELYMVNTRTAVFRGRLVLLIHEYYTKNAEARDLMLAVISHIGGAVVLDQAKKVQAEQNISFEEALEELARARY